MIPSVLCYVPPSVELLGLTTPQFLHKIDAAGLYHMTLSCCAACRAEVLKSIETLTIWSGVPLSSYIKGVLYKSDR